LLVDDSHRIVDRDPVAAFALGAIERGIGACSRSFSLVP